jgi:23S rRNA (pseudouridine1915-N3)-methyltransferase
MKIVFITVGKQNDLRLADSIMDYTSRISRYFQTEWKIILSSDMKKEAKIILKTIEKNDFLVALEEKGKELDTIELSQFLEKRMVVGNKKLIFVIGGAYGLDKSVLERSNFLWSLSKLTLPHQIVRLVLAESFYRAISVIKKEPYHHA